MDVIQASLGYQAVVSEKLADQVLAGLWELLRGFQRTGTGHNGHHEDPSGMVLGKHRLFAGGSRNVPITIQKDPRKAGSHAVLTT